MAIETIRFSLIGTDDISIGSGSFEVRLADERIVSKQQVNLKRLAPDISEGSVLFMGANDIAEDTTFTFDATNNILTVASILGGSASGGDITIESTSDATKGDVLLNPDSGNVGIGVSSSPDSVLHVAATGATVVTIENDSGATSGDPSIQFDIANTNKFVLGVDDSDSDTFKIGTGSTLGATTALSIDSSRNVGINLDSPDGSFHIRSAAASAAAVSTSADDLIVENSSNAGITIRSGASNTGIINFDDSGSAGAGAIQYSHATDQMAFHTATAAVMTLTSAAVFINETSESFNTNGLVVNMENASDHFFTMKSDNVTTGATTLADSDTFAYIQKSNASAGGFHMIGISAGTSQSGIIEGIMQTPDTATTTGGSGIIELIGSKLSGTTRGDAAATENILVVGTNATTRMILKGNGDLHLDGTSNASSFDDFDDVRLLTAVKYGIANVANPKQIIGDWIDEHKDILVQHGIVSQDGFVNLQGVMGLMIDAFRQIDERLKRIET